MPRDEIEKNERRKDSFRYHNEVIYLILNNFIDKAQSMELHLLLVLFEAETRN